MSILIDKLMKRCNGASNAYYGSTENGHDLWYIKKFEEFKYIPFIRRIVNSFRVLTGHSIAVHFKEDEF